MLYTIGEMEKSLGIPASTLRYYDKEGLLPFVERTTSGIRMFSEQDYEWLKMIECMKKAGMPLKDIKKYIELTLQGDSTIHERLELFKRQRELLLAEMTSLQKTLDVLEYKCWYYETAEKAGSVEAVKNLPPEEIPPKYQNTKKQLSDTPKPVENKKKKISKIA